MITKEELVKGDIYRVVSRNLTITVYDGDNGFVGIREKFGSRYLFTEYMFDGVSPYGTVRPLENLGKLPPEIEPVDGFYSPGKFEDNPSLFVFLEELENGRQNKDKEEDSISAG